MKIKKNYKKKLRKSRAFSFVNLNFQKSLNQTPLLNELINIGAFKGDYYKYVHFSQENLIYGYKNNISFYNIEATINLFNKAAKFLRAVKKKKNQNLVFVGNPPNVDLESRYLFRQIKIPFFAQGIWRPGFFSRKYSNCKRILIIYDIKNNYKAFSEAVAIKVPVVAFATPKCDIRGVDYPVVLNLENAGLTYALLCKILIKR
jgi:ribosomal protein S2